MRYLAAPWRAPYVKNVHKPAACVFCSAPKAGDDGAALILHRGRRAFVILNKYPYQSGHLMVAPFRHTAVFDRASKPVSDEIMDLLKLSLRVLKAAYRPHGFNVGLNLGRSAGAGVVDHFHVHVVPRWTGDSNFMPVAGGTKVVIEDLGATLARLAPLFAKAASKRPRSAAHSQ
jgi:ATP adenylyltransferase